MIGEVETIIVLPFQVLSIAQHAKGPEEPVPQADTTISFGDEDLEGVHTPQQDALIISAGIGDPRFRIKRILIGRRSSVDILFESTLLSMKIPRERLESVVEPLYGFDNAPVLVGGTVTLPVMLGEFPRQTT